VRAHYACRTLLRPALFGIARRACLETARLYVCARCRVQVLLCSRCDRGQMYCGPECAQDARRQAQRQAASRYQASRRGRLAHAQRARRYRARREIVTHQGSPPAGSDGVVAAVPDRRSIAPRWHCHCCGAPVSQWLRIGFVRRRRDRRSIPTGECRGLFPHDHCP